MASSASLLVIAVALVLLGGVFAAADAAVSTVSPARVDGLIRLGRPGARQLAAVVAERRRHINLLLLLRMICELTATVLVTVVFLRWISPEWLAVIVTAVVMVVISYVVIGVGPRTIGRQHPYRVGAAVAGPVRVLGTVLGPLSRLLILVGNAITPGQGFREGPFTSEIELRELVDLAQERGVVEPAEREMIHSVFELGDTVAREVMVPRTEIIWIEQEKTVRQALALSLRTGFTRLPVIGESVDDIVGVVNLKDLVRASLDDGSAKPVAQLMYPASFVPDSKRLDDLLREMQLSHNHMAIAVDEYGGTAGLLTIEDILEEIVGEITDESDLEERPPVEHLDDKSVRVSARLGVDDLGELFGLELADHDVETVGGLLAQRLGRVPLPGAEAEVDGLRLHAEGGKDRRGRMRITTVVVRAADDAIAGRRVRTGNQDERDGSVE
ncbi:CBS domain containing-hemolysin-like protein [Amycolatopsis bartoniae]|uniref:Membrane protein n=1 Tax=Amycolatopsis bartoniae TaxID=941986 RepID=A0A8H9IZD5_9PSEU|nr:hemolysin family protein [Amycolatopsis bartoniae]MBB2935710.1 CBS domain containing-hemolysin-like protein [Amycolatopsis bartoniae]TVT05822.1 HlyC/CorC family transporter [Amycolatopsis bartoniae]GHF61307.1 membrane protein [Amycolatopsis bartoniae]